jgi:hypothetical protein
LAHITEVLSWEGTAASVANWPKFLPQKIQKWPFKNLSGRKKQRPLIADFSKNVRKVAELFICTIFT